MPCPKKHKMFLSYLRLSTKEGFFSETTITDNNIRFGRYNKEVYQECEWCCQVFKMEVAFKENAFICCSCYKLLESEDIKEVISPKIMIYYAENQIYRICTNMDRYLAEAIFKKENIRDKEGTISKEAIYNFLNSQTS